MSEDTAHEIEDIMWTCEQLMTMEWPGRDNTPFKDITDLGDLVTHAWDVGYHENEMKIALQEKTVLSDLVSAADKMHASFGAFQDDPMQKALAEEDNPAVKKMLDWELAKQIKTAAAAMVEQRKAKWLERREHVKTRYLEALDAQLLQATLTTCGTKADPDARWLANVVLELEPTLKEASQTVNKPTFENLKSQEKVLLTARAGLRICAGSAALFAECDSRAIGVGRCGTAQCLGRHSWSSAHKASSCRSYGVFVLGLH